MKHILTTMLAISICIACFSQQSSVSFEKWISLKSGGGPVISPDGKMVAYTVTSTDWKENSYDSELWLYKEGQQPFQLTRTPKGSSFGAQFTPDNKWISFLADRGEKTQLYLISVYGGEAMQVTKEEDGINAYAWNPDGTKIAFTKTDAESKTAKSTKERYGAFGIEGEEYRQSHLWLLNFNYDSILAAGELPCFPAKPDSANKNKLNDCITLAKPVKLTDGNFNVAGFRWHPSGTRIAINKQPDPLINSSVHTDIAVVDISTKQLTTLVSNPSSDFFLRWDPTGNFFLYNSNLNDTTSFYFTNSREFIFDMNSKKSKEIGTAFDEQKNILDWNQKGIYFAALQRTAMKLFRLDPVTGATTPLDLKVDIINNASFSKDASRFAFSGRSNEGLGEIFLSSLADLSPTKATDLSKQITGWNTPLNEVVSWKSKDGTTIEGVLLKPRNYNASKKYPLLVLIHGGPTGVDFPDPVPTYVYPVMQWCEKGALVLRVNYRGSAGYGAKFRALNVRNLGVGDMWDVVSGVQSLVKKGMVDTTKMGCMGWSQGGYISAFLTTNTTMFKAISVGAGISNWVTYYVNTDITPFTRQYLKADPWRDMNVYLKTSPMTNINKARTPTLIQHGEMDKRVPIPNAYELYRGLQDRGIPSKLIVYKGFGHGINKPKERLAAVWHNWQWFNKYIWGETLTLPTE